MTVSFEVLVLSEKLWWAEKNVWRCSDRDPLNPLGQSYDQFFLTLSHPLSVGRSQPSKPSLKQIFWTAKSLEQPFRSCSKLLENLISQRLILVSLLKLENYVSMEIMLLASTESFHPAVLDTNPGLQRIPQSSFISSKYKTKYLYVQMLKLFARSCYFLVLSGAVVQQL